MSDFFKVTVSQVTRRLASTVQSDKALSDIYVKGEISNCTYHRPSGHVYFTLKDDTASIKCVMFRSYAERLDIRLDSGMSVIVRGSVKVYERDGSCQLYAVSVMSEGDGEAYLAFQAAKQQLEKEGYFAKKRPIPPFCRKICIITSEKAAALQDMLNIIGRRSPITEIIFISATVQGDTAPATLIAGLKKAQTTDADLIIIGRGGGSAEDLSAFNDIALAKELFNSRIPTISAVGHETDFSITDFVADLRAPTPSAAAELATVVTTDDMLKNIDGYVDRIKFILEDRLYKYTAFLDAKDKQITALSPSNKLYSLEKETELKVRHLDELMRSALAKADNRLEYLYKSINQRAVQSLEKAQINLDKTVSLISALNPMSILNKGYSVVFKDKQVVSGANALADNDKIEIRFKDGSVTAVVENINR